VVTQPTSANNKTIKTILFDIYASFLTTD